MSDGQRRVVITGIGVISPLGLDTSSMWDALVNGRSGIGEITLFDSNGLPARIAGEVKGFKARNFVPKSQRKNLKVMARDIQLGVASARPALEDAGLLEDVGDPVRIGIDFGASMISTELIDLAASANASLDENGEFDYHLWGEAAMSQMPPLWLLKYLPNMPACHVSILYDLQGPNNSITMGEAASNLAIGEAYHVIRRGAAELMLAGGCDSKLNPLALTKQSLHDSLSTEVDSPERACRPFDAGHNGSVIGEGAAVLVLEELEHARSRGAQIHGEIVGCGAGADAPSVGTAANGSGIRIAVKNALNAASMTIDQIGYYNAHGVSTPEGDRLESRALQHAFGDALKDLPVSAHKSNFGNAVAGSGALELVAGLLSIKHGVIPPTLNYEQPDPDCSLNVVAGSAREMKQRSFVSVNSTPIGQAAAVVVKAFEG